MHIARVPSRELMDDELPASDLAVVLDDLWRINRWFGGVSGGMRLLDRFFLRTGVHPVRVLDVGAGDGRLAARLTERLRRQGVKFVVLDRRVSHLRHGQGASGAPGRVAADVLSLPFQPASFDVVMCNLFLHHFSGGRAEEMLGALVGIAGEAVLINDLDRRWLPYFLIRHARLLARHPISRLDGAASVHQAYTRDELLRLARQVRAEKCEFVKLPFFRHGLILWKVRVAT